MQNPTPDWAIEAKALGLTLECIACNTGKSYSLVYRYMTGTRRPSEDWLSEVEALLERARKENS
jgi:hypothetical protein